MENIKKFIFEVQVPSKKPTANKELLTRVESLPYFCYDYYNIYCNYTYHLLLLPFKVALCATLSLSMMVVNILNIRLHIPQKKIADDPFVLYKVVLSIVQAFYFVVFAYVSFFKQDSFRKIFDISLCGRNKSEIKNTSYNKDAYFASALYIYCIISSISLSLWEIGALKGTSIFDILKKAAGEMQYVFFQRDVLEPIEDERLNIFTAILSCYYIMTNFGIGISVHLVVLLFYLASFSAWKIITEFSVIVSMQNDPDMSPDLIISLHDKLKQLLSSINCLSGGSVLLAFADGLPYFSYTIFDFIDGGGWMDKLFYFKYCISYVISYIVASEAYKNMEDCKEYLFKWARNDHSYATNSRIHDLLQEMSATSYGVKGCGYFTVTYEFLGSILSMFMTYTIIMLQFRIAK